MTRLRILPLAVLATLALATPAQAAKSVKGKWKGTVHSGNISFPMKMTIKRTKVGLDGRHALQPGHAVSRHADRHLAPQRRRLAAVPREVDDRICTGDDKIFIKRKGAKLRWRATAPSGQVGKALLRRA